MFQTTRKSCSHGFSRVLLGLLLMSTFVFVTGLRSEPIQIEDVIRKPALQCRKHPFTKDLTIIKIRSASGPSSMLRRSENFGSVLLEKYSSHRKDQVKAIRFSPSKTLNENRRKVECPEFDRRSEPLRSFEPCKLSSCPLCKREHPRTSTRLKLPFHLFSP